MIKRHCLKLEPIRSSIILFLSLFFNLFVPYARFSYIVNQGFSFSFSKLLIVLFHKSRQRQVKTNSRHWASMSTYIFHSVHRVHLPSHFLNKMRIDSEHNLIQMIRSEWDHVIFIECRLTPELSLSLFYLGVYPAIQNTSAHTCRYSQIKIVKYI